MSRHEDSVESARQTWSPLVKEIKSLVDALCVLDNDETKCVDILAKHIERIQNTIPPKLVHIQYPKPIHKLLSVQPLTRIEIPLDVLDTLVSSGFQVDEYYGDGKNKYGYWEYNVEKITCLHLAVKNHHYNAARWLVQHGADCNKCSYDESISSYRHQRITPITMLANHRNAPMDLFSKLNTTKNLDSYSNFPLDVAVQYGHTDIALHLIELGYNVNVMSRGTLPLHIAVEHGHTELALSLIKHGASVNQTDASRDLPLTIAVEHGHTEVALSLIKHGSFVNKNDTCRHLPLHVAVEHGHTEIALSLIKHGANLNQNDIFGHLPLHIAAEHGHTEIALSLIKHGASVIQNDRLGYLPLHIAVKHGHTEHSAVIDQARSIHETIESSYYMLHFQSQRRYKAL